jgi:hypothetical protein
MKRSAILASLAVFLWAGSPVFAGDSASPGGEAGESAKKAARD